jgi:hypothetical protein
VPQRVIDAIGSSPYAARLARAQQIAYAPFISWAQRSPLHSDVLGHSLHPPLTDVTAGCWLATSVLDLFGGASSRRGAALLASVGVAAAVPTALAGASDWAQLSGAEQRIGAVHAACTDVATFLFIGSVVARARGAHRTGVLLALGGNLTVAGAGLLGGHLALSRGTARRTAETPA